MRDKLFVLLAFIILLSSNVSLRAQANYEGVKAVLIYKLSKHIIWPEEKKLKEFRIGFYGENDETYQHFKSLKNPQIRNKPLKTEKLTNLANASSFQILVVDKNSSTDLSLESSLIENKQILLISEQSPDLKNIMLNIIYDDQHQYLSYQINTANILLEQLEIDPELLLLRGTEVDVRQLYHDMKTELKKEKEAVDKQKRLILGQEKRIRAHKDDIIKLTQYSDELNMDIGQKAVELDELLISIQSREDSMINQQIEFNRQLTQFRQLKQEADQQQDLISAKTATLDSLENATNEQQKQIKEQSLTLSSKEDLIGAQQKIIYLTAGLILVILISLIFAYRAYKTKGTLANKLANTNTQLKDQHLDNLKLNEDLKKWNEMLELKVSERTKGLKEKNEQLTEYAFVNSHLLRAPLSRILGLSQLLQASSSQEDLDMVNAMKDSADELDALIRRINVLLDEEGSFDRSKIEELIKRKIYDAEAHKSR